MKIYKRDVTPQYFNQISKLSDYEPTTTYVPYSSVPCVNRQSFKPIAFYLPQFYQTSLNDASWGEGYTEWSAVTRAVPAFFNHYQPHLPDALGYYNLTMTEVLQKQIALAKQYGIYGFCFYFYNFGDQCELRLPLEIFCKTQSLDFPFCLCWANENWTRKWDGRDGNILALQKYDKLSLTKVIEDATQYLTHRNYIKIDGKPLFIVYNPSEIPDLQGFASDFRHACSKHGIGNVHLSIVNKMFEEPPQEYGFDSVTEFPPHGMQHLKRKDITNQLFHNNFQGDVFDLEDYVNNLIYTKPSYPVFRTAFPSWDNTARRRATPHVFYGSSPKIFALWLRKICRYVLDTADERNRIFFINAWNEWSEGAHLEPDKKYGYAYLQTVKDILNGDFS